MNTLVTTDRSRRRPVKRTIGIASGFIALQFGKTKMHSCRFNCQAWMALRVNALLSGPGKSVCYMN